MNLFWQIVNILPQPRYCERISNYIFAEPVNLITNLAFIISAFFVYKMLKAKNVKNSIYNFFPWIIFLISLGSSLWHLYGSPITLPFDAVPVYIFLGLSLFLLLENLSKSAKLKFGIIGIFILFQIFLTINFPHLFNGSIHHIASVALLSALIIWIYRKIGKTAALQLFYIFLIYAVAIIFRTIDIQICPIFAVGTHFLWHIFVAIGGYYIVKFLISFV